MNLKKVCLLLAAAAVVVGPSAVAADADFEGARDYPDLPRVEGARIGGYKYAEYDAGRFAIGDEEWDPTTVSPEGKRTRIIYIGSETQSSLQVFRNYQKAFARIGDLDEVYSCQKAVCSKARIGLAVTWAEDNRIPNDFAAYHHYGNDSTHQDPMYYYATAVRDGKRYHLSVFTAVVTNSWVPKADGRPVAHIEIVEEEGFAPDLVLVDAQEIASELTENGHIALYGIHFDTDSAQLRSSSMPAIAEIAKTLKGSSETGVYVVGHTDGAGEYAHNQALSMRRAAAVVGELTDRHGIAADRLTPLGVGPAAPKASNATEQGRALNRRVEIVTR